MGTQRACIVLWASAVTTLAAVAHERPAVSSTPDSTPFYQGVADQASLERIVEARLDRAKQLLQDLLAVSGKRTPENTLRLYDSLLMEHANAERQMNIIGSCTLMLACVPPPSANCSGSTRSGPTFL